MTHRTPIFHFSDSACQSHLVLSLWVIPGETLLVRGSNMPLNPLFHYPASLGYWYCARHDFFVASVNDGFGAVSADYGGAFAY